MSTRQGQGQQVPGQQGAEPSSLNSNTNTNDQAAIATAAGAASSAQKRGSGR